MRVLIGMVAGIALGMASVIGAQCFGSAFMRWAFRRGD